MHDNVDHPVTLYAASKKANELMAHTYSHLYKLPTTGLSFFTVYGPWGRPDMALFLFSKAILAGEPIDVFNHGQMRRDFTYIDDIVEGVVRVADQIPSGDNAWDSDEPDAGTSSAPYKLYNIGNNNPGGTHAVDCDPGKVPCPNRRKTFLAHFGRGHVPATCADVDALAEAVGFRPATPIEDGVSRFVQWYREYFRTN